MTDCKGEIMPTLTAERQLLGYGRHCEPDDYTPDKLQRLAAVETRWVLRLQAHCREHFQHSQLRLDANRLRRVADVLNERIDQDATGGSGGTTESYPFPDLPAANTLRVDVDNAAHRALLLLHRAHIGQAHDCIRCQLEVCAKKGLDTGPLNW
jgi:hypothetical protein